MKFIVIWTVVNLISIPCEEPQNPYGIVNSLTTITSINRMCVTKSIKEMQKEFDSYEDAKKFIDEAPKSSGKSAYIVEQSYCTNFKLFKEIEQ